MNYSFFFEEWWQHLIKIISSIVRPNSFYLKPKLIFHYVEKILKGETHI